MDYSQDYEKALKYAANESWKGLLAGIHEEPHNRLRYGVLADWLEENGHEDLAHFFRKHGFEPEHEITIPPLDVQGIHSTVLNSKESGESLHIQTYNPPPSSTESEVRHIPAQAWVKLSPNHTHYLYLGNPSPEAAESLAQLEDIK